MSGDLKVEYNFLGKCGLKVSNICLGAMTFGTTSEGPMGVFFSNPKQTNEADSHKILDRYVELGGNFIDTADIYSCGLSEKIIGTWLKKQNREDIVIATKCRFPLDITKTNGMGLSRRHIMKSCDDSLKRLQTDYIDLYQAHMWDNGTPIEETLRAFDDLVKCGKIRYYGFSNVCGWQLQKIVETAKQLNLNPCVSLQQQYSLLRRDSEWEAFQVCQNEGIAVLPWSPLKGGMLTGKFKRDQAPDAQGSRAGYMHAKKQEGKTTMSNWDEFASDEKYWALVAVMEKVAKKHASLSVRMSADTKVEYQFLGKSGLKVTNICLGAMTFGSSSDGPFAEFYTNPKQLSEADAHKVLDRYVELGGNFIDTADIYATGKSETIIGNWLKKKNRENIIIATKCRMPIGTGGDWMKPNACGLSRRHIVKSCEESLKRLQTDYIDLYQGHMWDNGTPIEETLRAFDDLVKSGKIRYYGFSNVCGWQLQKIVDTARELNLSPCVSLQQQYSLLDRDSELEAFMVCQNEGIGVLPWGPLKSGMLTGKFKKGQAPDSKGSRVGYLSSTKASFWDYWGQMGSDENYWKLISVIERIAKQHGKSVPQIALRWLIQRAVVSSVIIGCTSIQQLEDNMGASGGWELSAEEMKELCEAAPLNKPYPYGFIWGFSQMGRFNKFNRSLQLE